MKTPDKNTPPTKPGLCIICGDKGNCKLCSRFKVKTAENIHSQGTNHMKRKTAPVAKGSFSRRDVDKDPDTQSTPDKMSRNLPASMQPQVKVAESGGHIEKNIFSTTDLGKRCKTQFYDYSKEVVCSPKLLCPDCSLIKKERQRLRAEVEKVLDEAEITHLEFHDQEGRKIYLTDVIKVKELKKRLGI